ncbi:MAG: serine dehydratase subunit alpha family protein [Clostridia bacterium]|nr:serine dehydratase subunit alpha family protein [Clostridia bacterium]
MHELTKLIQSDMIPALGVTEPGAIAFCVAKARSYTGGGTLKHVTVAMNSGMYKNAFTCGIPNSDRVGNLFAAALGYVAGNADKGLEALADVKPEDSVTAQQLIDQGRITVVLSGMTSRIYIQATVETDTDKAVVTIRDSHINVTRIERNGEILFETEAEHAADTTEMDAAAACHEIHNYTLAELLRYAETVPIEEIAFVGKAYEVNLSLFQEGLSSPRTTFASALLAMNGGEIISSDEKNTASLLCNAAIEARVLGLDKPAMSITGSGAHGIITTLPLYGVCKIHGFSEDRLYRATMLSYLVCTYIKEYSGRLSAFCGCAIAAGSGMACALCYLKGGGLKELEYTLSNMASSITGMICDGGNQGCTMKGVAACDAAFRAVDFALKGVHIDAVHGINGATPEETMRNMGLIASPGMVQTEKTIVEIFENKLK